MGGNTQKYVAELFGTAVLVLIGCSSIAAEGFGAAAPIGFIGIGMTLRHDRYGDGLRHRPDLGRAFQSGGDGGGWASGRMSTSDAIGYIISQIDRRDHRRAVSSTSS